VRCSNVEASGEGPPGIVDAELLLNLFDNAVKFGPPGQVVRVGVARVNGSAKLSVTDQGPGVPEEERERIWEPYYRGSSSAAPNQLLQMAARLGADATLSKPLRAEALKAAARQVLKG